MNYFERDDKTKSERTEGSNDVELSELFKEDKYECIKDFFRIIFGTYVFIAFTIIPMLYIITTLFPTLNCK
ncbi:hypothetical protein [Methylotenera sp. 1P/1]|uniref:hypothetical protein n=1 Tax=Methylotenera sp. 1P/1 TaxID=1131551 RepID=UPI00036DE54F|nr:hypothetical protein [Methylotenera sp. 1P/1]